MQEYKREHARAIEQIDKLQEKQVDYEAHLSTVDIYWNKVKKKKNGRMIIANIVCFTMDQSVFTYDHHLSIVVAGRSQDAHVKSQHRSGHKGHGTQRYVSIA